MGEKYTDEEVIASLMKTNEMYMEKCREKDEVIEKLKKEIKCLTEAISIIVKHQ